MLKICVQYLKNPKKWKNIQHFCFSSNPNSNENPPNSPNTESEHSRHAQTSYQFNDFEKNLIKQYQVDPFWNMLLDLEKDHNLQKQLIISRKDYQKSTYELRSAILFEDLLKTQLSILIYDTKKKPFLWHMLKILYMFVTVGTSLWGLDLLVQADPRNKVLLDKTFYGKVYKFVIYTLCTLLFFVSLGRHLKFTKRYVQKIVYDTQKQEFTLTKRKFFGRQHYSTVSRYKLLYTQSHFLTSKGTNYYNIDTKQQYGIVYKQAWIKQDLFSHLISQRIKV